MRRHAGAEIEGDAVEVIARPRRAIAAALLQAGDMRIAKIPAARTLREVAAERGEMTDLRRGETQCGRRDAGIGRRDARVGADRGDGGEARRWWRRRPRPMSRRSYRARRRDRSAVPCETPLRRRSQRSVPAARNSARERKPSSMRTSCCGPPFQGGDQTVGPDRNFRQPDAGGVADGVGQRRRGRHRRHLADPDAAAEHVIEAGFVEMHSISRACRDIPGMR